MAQSESNRPSAATLLVDAILVIAFFIYISWVCAAHVPSNDKKMIVLWGCLAGSCMTGVFWLCLQMFRVVARAQRLARRK